MKKTIYILLVAGVLLADGVFDTKLSKENKKVIENEKIKCRWVCDKKIYKEQKIAEAISFYKNSKYYTFSNKKNYY